MLATAKPRPEGLLSKPASETTAEPRSIEPVVPAGKGELVLDKKQVREWREHGALVLADVIPVELLQKARTDVQQIFEKIDSEFGGESDLTFPSTSDSLNKAVIHERLIRMSSQLLGVSAADLRLTQAESWGKMGPDSKEFEKRKPADSYDQRIHCDYPNHTLVHPSPWSHPDAVSLIIYLSECEECEGGTAVVPRQGARDPLYHTGATVKTPGVYGHWINDREMAEENYRLTAPEVYEFRKKLYNREKRVRYKMGTVLVYRQDLWHRGTMVKNGVKRYVMNITFRRKDADWIMSWQPGWARKNYRLNWPERSLEKTIASLSPVQRAVIGFPPPGHAYWNEYTLATVAIRYKPFGLDMKPYEDAYNARKKNKADMKRAARQEENERRHWAFPILGGLAVALGWKISRSRWHRAVN